MNPTVLSQRVLITSQNGSSGERTVVFLSPFLYGDYRQWTPLPFWIAWKLQTQETCQSCDVLFMVTFVRVQKACPKWHEPVYNRHRQYRKQGVLINLIILRSCTFIHRKDLNLKLRYPQWHSIGENRFFPWPMSNNCK